MKFRALCELECWQVEDYAMRPVWNLHDSAYPDRHNGRRYAVHSIDLVVEHPDGGFSAFTVYPMYISETGIGLLHGGYVHVNSICTFFLPTVDGEVERLKAVVVRCFHQKGILHEVGAAFDEAIDLSRYLACNK